METIKQIRKGARALLETDEAAYHALEPYRDTPLVRAISFIGKLGDQPQMRVIAGSTLLAGLATGEQRLARAGLRMLVAHEAATLLKDAVKERVDRHRPQKAKGRRDRKLKPGKRTAKAVTSFPSGHSAGAIASARAFAREYPELAGPAVGSAALVAAAQVPKCSHYVTDVAAGLSVGIIAEALVDLVWRGATSSALDGRHEVRANRPRSRTQNAQLAA